MKPAHIRKSILNLNTTSFWIPQPEGFFPTYSANFLIAKSDHVELKELSVFSHYLRFSAEKFLDLEGILMYSVKRLSIDSNGVCLQNELGKIEIFGELDGLIKNIGRFVIQVDFDDQFTILQSRTQDLLQIQKKGKSKSHFLARHYDKRDLLNNPHNLLGLQRQLQILRRINHNRVEQLQSVFETTQEIYLIFSNIEGVTLSSYLKQERLSEKTVSSFSKQLLMILDYLHEQNIMHRDINPQNILLTQKQDLVLINFGLAEYSNQPSLIYVRCGTPGYIAPEILKDKEYDNRVDLFSLGIVVYLMISREHPWGSLDQNYQDLIIKNYQGLVQIRGLQISLLAQDFLQKLLQVEPLKRGSATEYLMHPFINGGNDAKIKEFRIRYRFHTEQISKSQSNSPVLGSPINFKQSEKKILTLKKLGKSRYFFNSQK